MGADERSKVIFFDLSRDVAMATTGAAGGGGTPRNCVHKRIPGCTVKINTQNCAWFGRQISLITAMSFREAMPLRTTHQGLCPLDPAGGLPVPQTPCARRPNPGYATDGNEFFVGCSHTILCNAIFPKRHDIGI